MLALLDLDETLVDRSAGFHAWAHRLVDAHDLGGDALTWLVATDRAVTERGAFFSLVAGRFPALGPAAALWADYRRDMPELTQAFPGVRDGLIALRSAGWRLGVVSNGRVETQVGKLTRTGLLDLFDGVCISEDAGVRKPDRAVFDLARRRTGAGGQGPAWMVGDDPLLDISGGAGAGMSTMWITHHRPWPSGQPAPDRQASTAPVALRMLLDASTDHPG